MTTAEQIRDGLTIMLKYGEVNTCAEHDEFFAGPEDDDAVSKEDKKALKKLGWMVNEDGGWRIFT